jgi:hypothetical protein
MMIIGCDFHPRFQQIAYVVTETGEYVKRRLMHTVEAERFYRSLGGRPIRVGVEATGNFGWFRRLLGELGQEMVLGDATMIRASNPRQQRTGKRDARHILRLLVEGRFPAVWQPGAAKQRLRQLLLHRSSLVSCARGWTPGVPGGMAETTSGQIRRKRHRCRRRGFTIN